MKKSKRRTAARMYPLIEQWARSQQSKRTFCAAHQINLHTFNYWLKKYRQSAPPPQSNFLALELAPEAPTGEAVYLRYPNEVELHFSTLPSIALLTSLIKIKT